MSWRKAHKIVELTEKEVQLDKLFTGHTEGSVYVDPGRWYFPNGYRKYADELSDFSFEEGDVIVNTVPKSGTTWLQEVIWTMRNNSSFNHPMASYPLNIRTPCLEVDMMIDHVSNEGSFVKMFRERYPDFDTSHGMLMHVVKETLRPRTIKSHMSFQLLPPGLLDKVKVVYVIRDPRDVCISYHHHCRIFQYENYKGTFDEFIDAYLRGQVWLGPYWEHVVEAWRHRDHPNMHICFYEQVKKDPKREIEKLNTFLGTNLTSEQMDKIVQYSSFDEMKKRDNHVVAEVDAPNFMNLAMVKNEGGFFRKGQSGGWRNVLTQEQKAKFQKWIDANCPDPKIMEGVMA